MSLCWLRTFLQHLPQPALCISSSLGVSFPLPQHFALDLALRHCCTRRSLTPAYYLYRLYFGGRFLQTFILHAGHILYDSLLCAHASSAILWRVCVTFPFSLALAYYGYTISAPSPSMFMLFLYMHAYYMSLCSLPFCMAFPCLPYCPNFPSMQHCAFLIYWIN